MSLQHVYALLKNCERVLPDAPSIQRRARLFEEILDRAKTSDGVWRTYMDTDGTVKETTFPTARAMFESPQFRADLERYEFNVRGPAPEIQRQDCESFEDIAHMALNRR